MYEKSRDRRFLAAFPPRLLVLASSFFAVVLAVILAVTCFILALDKKSDPNAAVSLPGGQKFATLFTAGIFLVIIPLPLISLLSILVHNRQRYSPSLSESTRPKPHDLVQRLSLPPSQPFLFFSSTSLYRTILLIAFLVQLADTVAFTIVVCIMKKNEICLFNGRVVLCNLLRNTQKAGVIIPAFLQLSCQFVLFLLINPYTHQVEKESELSMNFDEVFGPLKGSKSQGPFQRIPIFDPDVDPENGDLLEEEGADLADTRYDRSAGPKPIAVRPANRDRSTSFDYSTPYDDPSSGTPFKKLTKPTRTSSTSSMQGPRPAPKRSNTLTSVASSAISSTTFTTTTSTSPLSITSGKNKEWFKRFKSKSQTHDAVPDEEAKRTTPSKKKSDVDGGEADGEEEEGLL